jgi:hypothetical protein
LKYLQTDYYLAMPNIFARRFDRWRQQRRSSISFGW